MPLHLCRFLKGRWDILEFRGMSHMCVPKSGSKQPKFSLSKSIIYFTTLVLSLETKIVNRTRKRSVKIHMERFSLKQVFHDTKGQ